MGTSDNEVSKSLFLIMYLDNGSIVNNGIFVQYENKELSFLNGQSCLYRLNSLMIIINLMERQYSLASCLSYSELFEEIEEIAVGA